MANEVFVLGSGFSKWLFEEMPLVKDLAEAVRSDDALVKDIHSRDCERLLNKGDIEGLMTFLSSSYPWKTQKDILADTMLFGDLVGFISGRIELAERRYSPKDKPEGLFLANQIMSRRLAVLTFNYDTILEQLLSCKHAIYNWLSFWKLPLRNVDERASQDIRPIFDGGSAQMEEYIDPNLVPDIIKLHGSKNWLHDSRAASVEQVYYVQQPYSGNRILLTAMGLSPLIVPPITDKAHYSNNYVLVGAWQKAAIAIREADRLVFFGYSLPESDLHFRLFLQTTVQPQTEVVVVNKDIDSAFSEKWKCLADSVGASLELKYLGESAGNDFCRDLGFREQA